MSSRAAVSGSGAAVSGSRAAVSGFRFQAAKLRFHGSRAAVSGFRAVELRFQAAELLVSGFRFQSSGAAGFRQQSCGFWFHGSRAAGFKFLYLIYDSIMAIVKDFEDLSIFQMARGLCKEVYAITKEGEFHMDSRFVQQIHAAAGSIMDNIAEGFERDGNKEFVNFLYIAKGSCGEVRSQIIRASDVGFIDDETAKKLYNDCVRISKAINKLIISIKNSTITGLKNKNLKHET